MTAISAIILTKDEEGRIARCIESVSDCVSEVFIVDSGSTDSTVKIARDLGARVVEHPFRGYALQRNWAQSNLPISTPWVLHVDADEALDSVLRLWLRTQFDRISQDAVGVLIRRRIVFLGKEIRHGGVHPTFHCRLFRMEAGFCERRMYDQHFVVTGPLVRAKGFLVEDNGSDVVAWCAKHLRWASLEAAELTIGQSVGSDRETLPGVQPRLFGSPIERRRWLRTVVYAKSPPLLRPWLLFLYRVVLRLGFLDGWRGMVYHFLQGLWFRTLVDVLLLARRDISNRPREKRTSG